MNLKKAGLALYKVYVGLGMAAMGFVAGGVIFAVIMRYCFSITFTFLEELITLTFAFTTFWGIGMCMLEDEHVVLDFFYLKIPEKIRRYVDIVNVLLTIGFLSITLYYTFGWIDKAGKALSNGLRVPYKYIYGAMPLGIVVSMVCAVIKLWSLIKNKKLNLRPADDEDIEEVEL